VFDMGPVVQLKHYRLNHFTKTVYTPTLTLNGSPVSVHDFS
jgi:hypothetical protein